MKTHTVRTIWLAALLAVALPYTYIAFGMEWRTEAGRIGPGFFPRLVGIGLVCCLVVAIVRSLRHSRATGSEGGGGTYPKTTSLLVAATVVFLVVFESLGALLASIGYLLAVLAALNRGRWAVNIPVAVLLPIGLYLLFQTWLNAGLPAGVLAVF